MTAAIFEYRISWSDLILLVMGPIAFVMLTPATLGAASGLVDSYRMQRAAFKPDVVVCVENHEDSKDTLFPRQTGCRTDDDSK